MNVKLIIIFVFSIGYAVFEIFMNLRQKRGSTISASGDKGSLRLLYFLIWVGYFLAFSSASAKFGRIYHWNIFFTLGAIVALTGLTIRILALLTLRKYFTYSVARVENHKLVTTGLYRYIRHPGYLGQLIIFLGISLSLSNWLSVLGMIIPVSAGFLYRIHVEERFMVEQMGDEYSEYHKKTKKIIPGIY